jgi:rod shape-determining protein MreB and related proteins
MSVAPSPLRSDRPVSAPAAASAVGSRPHTGAPTAVSVDLGSGWARLWVAGRGTVSGPCTDAFTAAGSVVRRGRVVDPSGCRMLLRQLLDRYDEPVPPGALVIACRPVYATASEEHVLRRVLTDVLSPSRLLFIDTVRAAAVGAGAAAGHLLIADIGAQLTEVALLDEGRVSHARRIGIGTADLTRGADTNVLAELVVRAIGQLRQEPGTAGEMARALVRGLVLVGDGATRPQLSAQLAARLRLSVHTAAGPRTAALTGAGLAAMAATRHPGR